MQECATRLYFLDLSHLQNYKFALIHTKWNMASNDTNNTNAYQNTENIVVSQQQSQLIHPSTQSTTAECKATEGNSLNSPLTQPQQISTPSMFDNSVLAETQRQNSGVKRPATTEFGKGNKVQARFDKAGYFDLRLEVARSI